MNNVEKGIYLFANFPKGKILLNPSYRQALRNGAMSGVVALFFLLATLFIFLSI